MQDDGARHSRSLPCRVRLSRAGAPLPRLELRSIPWQSRRAASPASVATGLEAGGQGKRSFTGPAVRVKARGSAALSVLPPRVPAKPHSAGHPMDATAMPACFERGDALVVRRAVDRFLDTADPAPSERRAGHSHPRGRMRQRRQSRALARFGRLDAVEHDPAARDLAPRARSGIDVLPLPPFFCPRGSPRGGMPPYDLVALLDVLELLSGDRDALEAIGRIAGTGGAVCSSPCRRCPGCGRSRCRPPPFPRYTRSSLARAIRAAGLEVERIGYFNAFLFRWLWRDASPSALSPRRHLGRRPPSPRTVNALLQAVFSAERHLIGRLPFPGGLSVYDVVRPPAELPSPPYIPMARPGGPSGSR